MDTYNIKSILKDPRKLTEITWFVDRDLFFHGK
jgi:hypothetical protein